MIVKDVDLEAMPTSIFLHDDDDDDDDESPLLLGCVCMQSRCVYI